jgi:hypothetical protein
MSIVTLNYHNQIQDATQLLQEAHVQAQANQDAVVMEATHALSAMGAEVEALNTMLEDLTQSEVLQHQDLCKQVNW